MTSLFRELKNTLYSPIQVKVRDATCNDLSIRTSSLAMDDIAHATRDHHQYPDLWAMLFKRLTDHKNYVHVLKALNLVEFLIRNGSDRFVEDCKDSIHDIAKLKRYRFFDANNVDVAGGIRAKAKALADLLSNPEALSAERDKASQIRNVKHQHVSSDTGSYYSQRSRATPPSSQQGYGAGSGNAAQTGGSLRGHQPHHQHASNQGITPPGSSSGAPASSASSGRSVDPYDSYGPVSSALAADAKRKGGGKSASSAAAPASSATASSAAADDDTAAEAPKKKKVVKKKAKASAGTSANAAAAADDAAGNQSANPFDEEDADPFGGGADHSAASKSKKKAGKKSAKKKSAGDDAPAAATSQPAASLPQQPPQHQRSNSQDLFNFETGPAPAANSNADVDFLSVGMASASIGGGNAGSRGGAGNGAQSSRSPFDEDDDKKDSQGHFDWGPDASDKEDEEEDDTSAQQAAQPSLDDPWALVDLDNPNQQPINKLTAAAKPKPAPSKGKNSNKSMAEMKQGGPKVQVIDNIPGLQNSASNTSFGSNNSSIPAGGAGRAGGAAAGTNANPNFDVFFGGGGGGGGGGGAADPFAAPAPAAPYHYGQPAHPVGGGGAGAGGYYGAPPPAGYGAPQQHVYGGYGAPAAYPQQPYYGAQPMMPPQPMYQPPPQQPAPQNRPPPANDPFATLF